jgi:hypothetical protein
MEENKTLEIIEKGRKTINNLLDKDFNIYVFTLNTLGNPVASVHYNYETVRILNKLGYRAFILHEKADYKLKKDEKGIGLLDWMGYEYEDTPHACIEGGNLKVTTEDFILIPEAFSNIMEQIKTFPCKKVVLSQSYHYIFELLPVGSTWYEYGFKDIITTSEVQSDYLKETFFGVKPYVINPTISDKFKSEVKLKKPIVAVYTREQTDTKKIIKEFYAKYPQYRFVTFRELRNLPTKEFATVLDNCCASVWVDDICGFGTFPLESMSLGVPVIGKIPNLIPEWMQDKTNEEEGQGIRSNGVWTNNYLMITDLIAEFLKSWFEDSIPEVIYEEMSKTVLEYNIDKRTSQTEETFKALVDKRIQEIGEIIKKEEEKLVTNE